MTLKWQDRLGAVAGFISERWILIAVFIGGLIIGGMAF